MGVLDELLKTLMQGQQQQQQAPPQLWQNLPDYGLPPGVNPQDLMQPPVDRPLPQGTNPSDLVTPLSYRSQPSEQRSPSPKPPGTPSQYYTPMRPAVDHSPVGRDSGSMGRGPPTYNNVPMAPLVDRSPVGRDSGSMGPKGGPQTYNNVAMAPLSDRSSPSSDPAKVSMRGDAPMDTTPKYWNYPPEPRPVPRERVPPGWQPPQNRDRQREEMGRFLEQMQRRPPPPMPAPSRPQPLWNSPKGRMA